MKLSNLYTITIFKNITENPIIKTFIDFIISVDSGKDQNESLKLYTDFVYKLYNSKYNANLYQYLKYLIYTDENILAKNAKNIKNNDIIFRAALYELSVFDWLLTFNFENIKNKLKETYPDLKDIAENLPPFDTAGKDFFSIDNIIDSYINNGYGIFAENQAFKYTQDKEIISVSNFSSMSFKELKNYEYQQEVILKNTKAFLDGKEANNILLYGDRGCGKSSTVKALINEFSAYNLKIIQITKESFIYLSDLYDKVRNLPLKFIIFADDLSFDENDANFSTIKAVLEGSLSDRPSNTVIYATTNRMHLVKESFSSREGSELHLNDTIDELVSLSDRFGIMLTFSSLTKNEYLDIVKQIADDMNIPADDNLYKEAEKFAALKAIRTPRTARQFITDYIANL